MLIGNRYSSENFPNILKLVDGLKQIGQKYNATAGQVALAWLLAQGDDVIPIPGTRQIKVNILVIWILHFLMTGIFVVPQ